MLVLLLNQPRAFPRLLLPVALLAAVFTAGCGRDEIKVYRVPKESTPQLTRAEMPAGHPDVARPATGPRLTWKTPDGWKEVPPGTVRVASFSVTGKDGKQVDVSVIPLTGTGGGDLGNVNRWRGQVGQPSLTEEELAKAAQPLEVDGQPAALYEQSGESAEGEPTGILAAIQHREGTAWFFKLTGDRALVAQQKPAFVEFLKSIRFVTGEAATAQSSTPPPREGKPQWTTPPGWREVPGGQFLVAKFVFDGAGDTQAAVNISSSAGDGGGLAANVNRWRKQLGLSELASEELANSVTAVNDRVKVVELKGERASLVAAIVSQPGQTWFYKLMGDPQIVAAQKDPFLQFVQEVKY